MVCASRISIHGNQHSNQSMIVSPSHVPLFSKALDKISIQPYLILKHGVQLVIINFIYYFIKILMICLTIPILRRINLQGCTIVLIVRPARSPNKVAPTFQNLYQ